MATVSKLLSIGSSLLKVGKGIIITIITCSFALGVYFTSIKNDITNNKNEVKRLDESFTSFKAEYKSEYAQKADKEEVRVIRSDVDNLRKDVYRTHGR